MGSSEAVGADALIPKIVHYVWVGPKPLPHDASKRIEEWQNLLPEYRIMRWSEDSIDFSPKFIRQAYSVRAYNRVANYARAAALYRYGGIYMDHDVELIRSYDDLLNLGCFFGFQTMRSKEKDLVNNAIIGSTPGHRFIAQIITALNEMDGAFDWGSNTGPGLVTRLLRDEGKLVPTSKIQRRADLHICPPSYFYPYEWDEAYTPSCITDETIAVHYWAHTWKAKPRPSLTDRLVASALRRGSRLSPTLTSMGVRAINAVARRMA